MHQHPVDFNWLFISGFLTDYSTLDTLMAMGDAIRWQVHHLVSTQESDWLHGQQAQLFSVMGAHSLASTSLGVSVLFILHSLIGLTWELAQSAPIWAALCYPICIVSPCSQHDTNPDSRSLCFWSRGYSALSPVTTMTSIWQGQAEYLTTMKFV